MPPLSPQRRRRGVCLTPQGLHKLQTAKHHLEWSEHERQRLTLEDLTARTGLDAHTLCKILTGTVRVDRKSLVQCFMAFDLTLEPADYESPPLPGATFPHPLDPNNSPQVPVKLESSLSPDPHALAVPSSAVPWIDGESLPDVPLLVGRELELETLSQWVQPDRGRVITILGMAGSGKTSLVAKLVEHLALPTRTSPPRFQVILWRSLRHAPTVEATLIELLQLLSPDSLLDCPTTLQSLISRLLQVLHQTPCLLVLDGLEAVLQAGVCTGAYQEGYEGYGELIRQLGGRSHQSCLILTSRERPQAIGLLEGEPFPHRCLQLAGLSTAAGLQILQAAGISPTQAGHQILLDQYAGNPCALQTAAATIHFLFLGEIQPFSAQSALIFGGIEALLTQQFERLAELEKTILYWLAIHRVPISVVQLSAAIAHSVPRPELLTALTSLTGRSLLTSCPTGFTLQNLLMEYVTQRLVRQIKSELATGKSHFLHQYELLQKTAQDTIQKSQQHFILNPIVTQVSLTDAQWMHLLQTCDSPFHLTVSYAADNLRHLLCHRTHLDVQRSNALPSPPQSQSAR